MRFPQRQRKITNAVDSIFPVDSGHRDPTLVERSGGDMFEKTSAVFTADERHRLALRFVWNADLPSMNCLMLNPSTATETVTDPTVGRCRSRAHRLGFGSLVVTNLFSYRSPFPLMLKRIDDRNHPDNDRFILEEARAAACLVCAWGSHDCLGEILRQRSRSVVSSLRLSGVRLHALSFNADGQPGHPLYLAANLDPVEWKP